MKGDTTGESVRSILTVLCDSGEGESREERAKNVQR